MGHFILSAYPWIKAFHFIFVICWMAALFYLPRLFVYHTQTEPGSIFSDQYLLMERRLIKIIMNPAMILSFTLGLALLLTPGVVDWHQGWIHLKLFLVLLLAAYHGIAVKCYKDFSKGKRNIKEVYFRVANEIPIVIMAVIVILAVVRPF